MKIERTESLQHPQPGGKKKNAEPTGERFGDVLEQTISRSVATSQSGPIRNLPPAGGIAGFIPSADKKNLIGRADQLLGLLESLQKNLSGPRMQMKEAYASMRAIEDRADELTAFAENLPEDDDLRDFLNRLVITASVEAIKFRRGDYL